MMASKMWLKGSCISKRWYGRVVEMCEQFVVVEERSEMVTKVDE